jgi:hypothetical protein
MTTCDGKEATPTASDDSAKKRAYTRPEVVELGDVRELTMGGGVQTPDLKFQRRN